MKPYNPQSKKPTTKKSKRLHQADRERRLMMQRKKEESK